MSAGPSKPASASRSAVPAIWRSGVVIIQTSACRSMSIPLTGLPSPMNATAERAPASVPSSTSWITNVCFSSHSEARVRPTRPAPITFSVFIDFDHTRPPGNVSKATCCRAIVSARERTKMTIERRDFLKRAGMLAATLVVPCTRLLAQPRFASTPFTLGVASGFPHPEGMTLWTRLVLADPAILAGAAVEVTWEVAADDAFNRIVTRGKALATPDWGHSVHVDVQGLEAARPYWYRFRAGESASPVGRTRTAPRADASAARLRFAFACCQQYEQGY